MTDLTIAAVPEATAQAFLDNLDKFQVLLDAGVFDLGTGKIEIDCFEGAIVSVRRQEQTYARRKQLSTPAPIAPRHIPP